MNDQDILFGILAAREEFINVETLARAISEALAEPPRSLAEALVESGHLSPQQQALIEGLVREQLGCEIDDPQSPLESMNLLQSVRGALDRVGSGDLFESLHQLFGEGFAAGPPPQDGRSAPGTSAGARFEILESHARGGLGEVFLAQDRELSRRVALKKIRDEWADVATHRARFYQEAEITGRLEHPGIVPVYALGSDDDGKPYYAMRLIRGDSLDVSIGEFHSRTATSSDFHGVEFRSLLNRLVDVCHAVDYAHSRGVIHRDIKPQNIMVGKYGETLVVDWGLAKMLDDVSPENDIQESIIVVRRGSGSSGTVLGRAVGTPTYMSPEQAAGLAVDVREATDIFSIGATLYHVLVGNPPRSGTTVDEMIQQAIKGEFVHPREVNQQIPRGLAAITMKAMDVAPYHRYKSARELAADIEQWLADEPVSAYREPLTTRAGRWMRHHRTFASSALVALVLAGVALVFGSLAWQAMRARELRHQFELVQRESSRLVGLRLDAESREESALAELQAGRFESALSLLDRGVRQLEDAAPDDELTDSLNSDRYFGEAVTNINEVRSRLLARRDRVRRIVTFYRLADEVEHLTAFEQDALAHRKCIEALESLEILQHGDWWARLPSEDLTPQQLDRLQQETYKQLLILASLHTKAAFVNIILPRSKTECLAVLATTSLIHAFRPAQCTETIAKSALARVRGRISLPRTETIAPRHAADYDILGKTALAGAENEWMLSMFPQDYGKDQPLAMARGFFQMSCQLAPDRYWTLYLLGHTESLMGEYDDAQQAFGRCIALRPDFYLAHAARSSASLQQTQQLQQEADALKLTGKEPPNQSRRLQADLLALSLRDAERARDLAPLEESVHEIYGQALAAIGLVDEAVDSFTQAVALARPLRWQPLHNYRRYELERLPRIRKIAEEVVAGQPENPRYQQLLAAVALAQEQYELSLKTVARAIELQGPASELLAIRGTALLHLNDIDQAEVCLREAISLNASSYLGLSGLAKLLEQRGDDEAALAAFDDALAASRVEWQRADSESGRGRMLLRMGKREEALKSIKLAFEIAPGMKTPLFEDFARDLGEEDFVQSIWRLSRLPSAPFGKQVAGRRLDSLALLNGGFELGLAAYWGQGEAGQPVWRNFGGCKSAAKVTTAIRHSGEFSLYIHNQSPAADGSYAATQQAVPCPRNRPFRLTLWGKGLNLEPAALQIIVNGDMASPAIRFPAGDFDWTAFEVEVSTTEIPELTIQIVSRGSGEVWIDDISISSLSAKTP